MWVASRVDLESSGPWPFRPFFMGLFLMLLVCVPGIGKTVGGAQRWFRLGPFSFQPSEIMKTGPGLLPGGFLGPASYRRLANFSGLMPYLILLGVTMILLEKQHDFGTAVLLALVTILLLFLAGIQWTFFLIPLSVLSRSSSSWSNRPVTA